MARGSRRNNAGDEVASNGHVTEVDVRDEHTDDDEPLASASVVDDLRGRLVDLQSTVERLVDNAEKATAEKAAVEPITVDPEIEGAARTLRFAQQTADAVIAEAREDAVAIVADAERQRTEIIRRAHQQAEADYAAERDEVQAASAAWQVERAGLLDQLDSVTAVFAKYQDGLSKIDTTVTSVAAHLRAGGSGVPGAAAAAADQDPFVFDVTELPETTGDFGWETDPDGSDDSASGESSTSESATSGSATSGSDVVTEF